MSEETKLVNLSGAQPKKAINPEVAKIPIKDLDDPGAGLVFLKMVTDMYPGITWGQLMAMKRKPTLSGWWTDFKGGVSDIYGGGKTFIGDVVEGTGDVLGSGVRLMTDEQVAGSVTTAAGMYATGGISGALLGIFSGVGKSVKEQSAKNPMLLWGGLGVGALLIFMLVKD